MFQKSLATLFLCGFVSLLPAVASPQPISVYKGAAPIGDPKDTNQYFWVTDAKTFASLSAVHPLNDPHKYTPVAVRRDRAGAIRFQSAPASMNDALVVGRWTVADAEKGEEILAAAKESPFLNYVDPNSSCFYFPSSAEAWGRPLIAGAGGPNSGLPADAIRETLFNENADGSPENAFFNANYDNPNRACRLILWAEVPPVPAEIMSRDQIMMSHYLDAFDFDARQHSRRFQELWTDDIGFTSAGFVALNKAKITYSSQSEWQGTLDCKFPNLDQGTDNSVIDNVPLAQVQTGKSFCVETTAGRTAQVEILSRVPGDENSLGTVTIVYRVWHEAGASEGDEPLAGGPDLIETNVSSWNIVSIRSSNGGNFSWIRDEFWSEGGVNTFREMGRDSKAVYLYDRKRKVRLTLDVSRNMIRWGDKKNVGGDLYGMTKKYRKNLAPFRTDSITGHNIVSVEMNNGSGGNLSKIAGKTWVITKTGGAGDGPFIVTKQTDNIVEMRHWAGNVILQIDIASRRVNKRESAAPCTGKWDGSKWTGDCDIRNFSQLSFISSMWRSQRFPK